MIHKKTQPARFFIDTFMCICVYMPTNFCQTICRWNFAGFLYLSIRLLLWSFHTTNPFFLNAYFWIHSFLSNITWKKLSFWPVYWSQELTVRFLLTEASCESTDCAIGLVKDAYFAGLVLLPQTVYFQCLYSLLLANYI